jgi:hypothetical protein
MAVSNGRLFWHAEWYSRHHEDSDDGFFVAWRRKAGDLLKKATACSGSRRLITQIGEFVLKYSS